ncbi:methionyl-tRNA formyltransferase [Zopfia rhizophila CBS 207.26]|uniref:methionyl-tRNA formyltransferase n=1 Tax=Zopfia rhizophila CBS 207.26 TaxID=1314779 RepID=A0A6A6DXJ7_9PEZI|nr:methionyl-tRNA formyltransferase [Zopfia rhizophila CBS 207.26]
MNLVCGFPSPIRCFSSINFCRYNSTKAADPLRILFCGSDEFSIASLRALNKAHQTYPELITSINVVHRPGKKTGRGLKVIREVPIKQVAVEELKLDTHEIDTFTGWTPPDLINLVVAVSFGLLVPPRILNKAKYGGLNVHPSLLPDLRGPAPLHHTLLKKRTKIGITVQTLHPKHFDQGMIVAQTPSPGLDIPFSATLSELTHSMGVLGGQMLVDVLRTRSFVPPIEDAGWYTNSGGPTDHAEKITKQHRYIDFSTATAEDIILRHQVLGDLWCTMDDGQRVIFHEFQLSDLNYDGDTRTGFFILDESSNAPLLARTGDNRVLKILSSTIGGGKRGQGNQAVKHALASTT